MLNMEIIELFLYLLSLCLAIGVSYWSYKNKGRYLNEYYRFVYTLPLFTILLLFKYYLLQVFPARKIFISSIVDLSLAAGFAVFWLPMFKEINFHKISSPKNKKWLWVFIAPYVLALFTGNVYIILDLYVYWSISVFIIVIGSLLCHYYRDLQPFIYTALVLFYAEFIVRMFSLLRYLSYSTVAASLVLGLTAVSVMIFGAFLSAKNAKGIDVFPEVKTMRLKNAKRVLYIAVLVSILSAFAITVSFRYYTNLNRQMQSGVQNKLSNANKMIVSYTEEFFEESKSVLELASSGFENNNYKFMKSAYNTGNKFFDSVSLIDSKGRILYSYPYREFFGKNMLWQDDVKYSLEERLPSISMPYRIAPGINVVSIQWPVFNRKRFIGILSGVINIQNLENHIYKISEEYPLDAIKNRSIEFILLEDNKIISASYKGYDFLSFNNIFEESFKHSNIFSESSFSILGKTFYVYTYLPKFLIETADTGQIVKILISLLFVLFLLILLFYSIAETLKRSDTITSKSVENAIKNEREQRKKAEEISKRLSNLITFLESIELAKSDKDFFNSLLDVAIRVIPNGQSGTIGLHKDGFLQFVAAKNYPIDIMRRVKIPIRKYAGTKQSACVINRIQNHDNLYIDENSINLLKQIGNYEIKSTIVAPIFLKNKRIGSIFIDNFDSESAFNKEDLTVAKAISQIASTFEESRWYIKEIEAHSLILFMVSEFLELLKKSPENSNLAQILLDVVRKRISYNIVFIGLSVTSITGMVLYCSSVDGSGYMYSDIPVIDIEEPVFFEVSEFEKFVAKYNIRCNLSGVLTVLVVPEKKSQFVSIFGFSSKIIPDEIRTLLLRTVNEVSYAVSSAEFLKEIKNTYIETLISMNKAVELKDPYTKNHSERVTIYSYIIGKKMGLNKRSLRILYYAALLHDIGKIGIPDSILKSTNTLSNDEKAVIDKHPELGAKIVGNIDFLKSASKVILHHHERWDGTGYPSRLKGNEIPLLSRIIAVADAFDAITSTRAYRKERSFEEAFRALKEESGRQFDPEVIDAFLNIDINTILKARNNPDIVSIYTKLFKLFDS